MNTLTTPVTDAAAASQAGWCEVYDIYLKAAITTPWGSLSVLRVTNLPGGLNFFKPQIEPETDLGAAATYQFWPIMRNIVKGDGKFTNDKLQVTASNVTREWAQMLAAVSWYDVPIVIRKVPTTYAGALTADDCAVLWSGQVDAVKVTAKRLAFECSSDLAGLQAVLPAENMHSNCRFRWADFQCTKIRHLAVHYKAKTVGSSSTTTEIKSAGLTEDAGSAGSYGTDLVNALSDGAITASSETSNHSFLVVGVDTSGNRLIGTHGLNYNDPVEISSSGTLPSPLVAATTYYALPVDEHLFRLAATPGGAAIDITSTGSGTITVDTVNAFNGYQVKSSKASYWKFGTDADWGTATQGFWQIPDAQAGVANADLKPWLKFDFGSARTPRVWRVQTPEGLKMEQLVRLIVLFSSTDNSTWTHETYFEIPPRGGVYYDILLPAASSARYWKICVRSRYGESLEYPMLAKVLAYEDGRHYWASGTVTFDAATATAALRGVSRRVLESYNGSVIVPALPVAPASGDTFVIERGCPRTFNACCERENWENFGGFTDLPYQTVIR